MGILEFINKNCKRLVNMDKDEFFSLPPKEFNKKLDELMSNMTQKEMNLINLTKEDIDELFDLMKEAKEKVKKMKKDVEKEEAENKNNEKQKVRIIITGDIEEDGFTNLHLESNGRPAQISMLIAIFASEYLKTKFDDINCKLDVWEIINKETIDLIKEGEDDDE